MILFTAQEFTFPSAIDTCIGRLFNIKKGDLISAVERVDGLWQLTVNGLEIFYSVGSDRLNELAGKKLVGD
jgi:hypothetical protein